MPTNLHDPLKPRNEVQASILAESLDKKWRRILDEVRVLDKEDDKLREEIAVLTNTLETTYPGYMQLAAVRSAADNAWERYYSLKEEKSENDNENVEEKEVKDRWLELNNEKRNLRDDAYVWLADNYPDRMNALKLLSEQQSHFYDKFVKAGNESVQLVREEYKEAYKEYKELEGVTYENGVNGFLATTREYQERRLKDLDTTLIERLRAAGILSDGTLAKGREKLVQVVTAIKVIPAQWRNLMKMKAKWAFAITVLAFGAQKSEAIKEQKYLEPRIDSIFASINASEHDSVRNVILHNIAGGDNMPESWRTFIANEDSLEFENKDELDEYIKTGKKISPNLENKLNYIVLQEMNSEYGNPKIQYGQNEGDKDRASFYSSNVILLPTYSGDFNLDDYFAELAHAKQLHDNPARFDSQNIVDRHKYDSISVANNISYHDAQLGEYKDSTTIEYEAHSIIQKQFPEEFERRKRDLILKILNPNKQNN